MQTAERVLALATAMVPGAGVFVRARQGRSANTRFALNEITTTGDVSESGISVEISLGRRHAAAESNQTDDASVRALIDRAATMARLAPEDPELMPLLPRQSYEVAASDYDVHTAELSATERAEAIKIAVDRADAARLQTAGFFVHDAVERAYANSAGLRVWHASSSADFTVTARTRDGTGSGWAGTEVIRASEIDAAALAKTATDKATSSANPQKLEPGRYTVVLEPAAVADLLAFLTEAFEARAADEGRSFFSKAGGGTRVGEKIFADAVTLETNPMDPETPGAPFDDEGLPIKATKWIDRGVATALNYSRYWAAKKGTAPTGQCAIAKLYGGTAARQQDLYAGIQRGLLVTRFWYTRWLDPKAVVITGLTRDGVFLIEDGKITKPVQNFRFNESPVTMLKNVDMMTTATVRVPRGGLWRVPALRTHDFNFASVSAAV